MGFHFKEEHTFPAVVRDILIEAKTAVVCLCADQRDDTALSEHFYRDLDATYRLFGHGALNKNFIAKGKGASCGDYIFRAVFAGAIEGAGRMYTWDAGLTGQPRQPLFVREQMGPLFYDRNGEPSGHMGRIFSILARSTFPEFTALSMARMVTVSVQSLARINVEPRRTLIALRDKDWHKALWEREGLG